MLMSLKRSRSSAKLHAVCATHRDGWRELPLEGAAEDSACAGASAAAGRRKNGDRTDGQRRRPMMRKIRQHIWNGRPFCMCANYASGPEQPETRSCNMQCRKRLRQLGWREVEIVDEDFFF